MLITCPRCSRSFEGELPDDPTITMRCRFCGSPFTQDELFHKKGSSATSSQEEEDVEVWDFTADELDTTTPPPATMAPGENPFSDIVEDDPFSDIVEDDPFSDIVEDDPFSDIAEEEEDDPFSDIAEEEEDDPFGDDLVEDFEDPLADLQDPLASEADDSPASQGPPPISNEEFAGYTKDRDSLHPASAMRPGLGNEKFSENAKPNHPMTLSSELHAAFGSIVEEEDLSAPIAPSGSSATHATETTTPPATRPQDDAIPDLPDANPMLAGLVERMEKLSPTFDLADAEDIDELPELPVQFEELQEAPMETFDPLPIASGESLDQLSTAASADSLDPLDIPMEPAAASARQEESIEDLLQQFKNEDVKVSALYQIRRNDKEFGPFDDEKVFELLKNGKLTGDEDARKVNERTWKPLDQWPDFRGLIDIIRRQELRTGWEARKRPKQRPQEAPTEVPEVEQTPEAAPKSKRPLLLGLAAVVVLALGAWIVFTFVLKKNILAPSTPPEACLPKAQRLLRTDRFVPYNNLLKSLPSKKTAKCLEQVRFLYAFLDSHGNDQSIRQQIDAQTQRFQKKNKNPIRMARLRLWRALSLRDKKAARTAFQQLKGYKKSKTTEWLYLSARVKELQVQYKQARNLYKQVLRKESKHAPALLGLYRTQTHTDPQKADKTLRKALRLHKTHLPTLLLALEQTSPDKPWHKDLPKLQKVANRLIQKEHHTTAQLAQWSYLEARRVWFKDGSAQALLHIDKAVLNAPKKARYRLARIRYYLQDGQTDLALQFIDKEPKAKHPFPLLRWRVLAMLQSKKVDEAAKLLQPVRKTKDSLPPDQRYQLLYLSALIHKAKNKLPRALKDLDAALGLQKTSYECLLAKAQIYAKRKQNKRCLRTLDKLPKTRQPHKIREQARAARAACED